jgi:type I restriction enzyme S subunit
VSSGWPLVTLGDIFAIARGGSPRPIEKFLTDDPESVNWIMISDATESVKYITSTKKRIVKEGVKRSRMVQPGDLLLTNSMSFGRPYIMKTSGCIHDGWLVLSPRDQNVLPDFFYYLLGSDFVYAEFKRRAAGATVKNLNIDLVKGVQVPLPPLTEQRRIAEILDQTEALRAKRRAALAQIDTLTQSIFLDLFGNPVRNEKGWQTANIIEICELVRGSSPRPQGDPMFFGGPVPRLMVADITRDGWLVTPRIDSLTIEGAKRSRPVSRGTVVMAVSGNIGLVSRLAIDACVHDGFVAFTQLDETRCEPGFLLATLHFSKALHEKNKAGAIFINLTTTDIKAMSLPLPPLPLQHEFARRITAVKKLRTAHRTSLAELDALFASLQHRAFRGEL